MIRRSTWFALAAFCLGLVSCADPAPKTNQPGQVSTIPWNHPEKWEGSGMMPGMIGTR